MLLTITTTGKVTLLIVAGAFIVWALVTAIWIPKRNPEFPLTLTGFILSESRAADRLVELSMSRYRTGDIPYERLVDAFKTGPAPL